MERKIENSENLEWVEEWLAQKKDNRATQAYTLGASIDLLQYAEKQYGQQREWEKYVRIANQFGHYYRQQGENQKAIQHLENTLIHIENHLPKDNLFLGDTYNLIGELYQKQNRLNHRHKPAGEKETLAFRHALLIYRKHLPHYHPKVIKAYRRVGEYLFQVGDYEKALTAYQKALKGTAHPHKINLEEKDWINHIPIPFTIDAIKVMRRIALLMNKQTNRLYVRQSGIQKKHLEETFWYYEQCDRLIDRIRQSYLYENAKPFLAQQAHAIYDEAFDVLYQLYQQTQAEQWKTIAFVFAEKSKAIDLLNYVKEAETALVDDIPEYIREKEKDIRQKLIELDNDFKGDITENLSKHKRLRNEYESLLLQIEAHYPEYYHIKYNVATTSIQHIQDMLAHKTLILSYFSGLTYIYIYGITNNRYEWLRLKKPDNLSKLIKDHSDNIEEVNRKSFIQTAHQLYQTLLSQVHQSGLLETGTDFKEEEIDRRLVIIPDARLVYLPFETLLYKDTDSNTTFKDLPYLLWQYKISYHYSASLFSYIIDKPIDKGEFPDSFLGIAPVYSKELHDDTISEEQQGNLVEKLKKTLQIHGRKYQRLLYSKHEVFNIRKLFHQKGLLTKALYHAEASKDNFDNFAKYFKFVHIAAHGVSNPQNNEQSGIIFHPSNNDEHRRENAVFTIADAYQLDLRSADLVVLSSCESGIGNLVRGKAMMSLNRGLSYSGASNVIFTLFKVYDKPSFELMQLLYEHILKGMSYAQALRLAKIHLIQRNDTTPLSWAGFVLIGR